MPEPVPIKWPIRVDTRLSDWIVEADGANLALYPGEQRSKLTELVDAANRGREAIELLRTMEWSVRRVTPITEDNDEEYVLWSCPACNGVWRHAKTPEWIGDDFGHAPSCPLARLIGSPTR